MKCLQRNVIPQNYYPTDRSTTLIRYAFWYVARNKQANDAVLLSFLVKSLEIGFIFLKTPSETLLKTESKVDGTFLLLMYRIFNPIFDFSSTIKRVYRINAE